jgi:hypothetical protein
VCPRRGVKSRTNQKNVLKRTKIENQGRFSIEKRTEGVVKNLGSVYTVDYRISLCEEFAALVSPKKSHQNIFLSPKKAKVCFILI